MEPKKDWRPTPADRQAIKNVVDAIQMRFSNDPRSRLNLQTSLEAAIEFDHRMAPHVKYFVEQLYRNMKQSIDERQASLDLQWKASMRAIKKWQKAHPGKQLVWPDHTDLLIWLLKKVEESEKKM